jgi:hypothetical protein
MAVLYGKAHYLEMDVVRSSETSVLTYLQVRNALQPRRPTQIIFIFISNSLRNLSQAHTHTHTRASIMIVTHVPVLHKSLSFKVTVTYT